MNQTEDDVEPDDLEMASVIKKLRAFNTNEYQDEGESCYRGDDETI